MDSASDSGADAPVRYRLTSRLSPEGQVSITLKLYRGNRIASTSPVALVDKAQTAEVMRKCRQHLVRLGIEGMTSEVSKPRGDRSRPDAGPPPSRPAPKDR